MIAVILALFLYFGPQLILNLILSLEGVNIMVIFGLVLYLTLATFITIGLCRSAAPQSDEERAIEDEDQLKYLRSLR